MVVIRRDHDKDDKVTTIEGHRYWKYQNEPREKNKIDIQLLLPIKRTDGWLSVSTPFLAVWIHLHLWSKHMLLHKCLHERVNHCEWHHGLLGRSAQHQKGTPKVSGLICGDGSLPSVHEFYLTLLEENWKHAQSQNPAASAPSTVSTCYWDASASPHSAGGTRSHLKIRWGCDENVKTLQFTLVIKALIRTDRKSLHVSSWPSNCHRTWWQ